MIKYPKLILPKQHNITKIIPLSASVYIEPKYDGTNITIINAKVFTGKYLNVPQEFFMKGLQQALQEKLDILLKLSKRYQIFLELGGFKNSPAGYTKCWQHDWDYVIFDIYSIEQGRFLKPEEVQKICKQYDLKFVGFRIATYKCIVEKWDKMLEQYKDFEGFVVKYFSNDKVVFVKFKHEYLKEKSRKEIWSSEIFGVINKVHTMIGDDIFDKKKAMPIIVKLAQEECKKHNIPIPSAKLIFQYYQQYLQKISSK